MHRAINSLVFEGQKTPYVGCLLQPQAKTNDYVYIQTDIKLD